MSFTVPSTKIIIKPNSKQPLSLYRPLKLTFSENRHKPSASMIIWLVFLSMKAHIFSMSAIKKAHAKLSKFLPNSRLIRTLVGVAFILGGLLGFLPVLGFWMVPLGLLVLSVDFPYVRRKRRQLEVWIWRKIKAWRKRKHDFTE